MTNWQQPTQPLIKSDCDATADDYLDKVCAETPAVARTLAAFGQESIASYLTQTITQTNAPYQKRDDLLDVVYRYCAPLLGENIAKQAVKDIEDFPAALTSNHHGVDYFAQSVQGTLLFSLRQNGAQKPAKTVPIFACGNIPLNNLTFPRGMLIYQTANAQSANFPEKFPIFPDRLKRSMVNTVAAYDVAMIRQASQRIERMLRKKTIAPAIAETIQSILIEDYCDQQLIDQPDYSKQSVVLNNRIWKRLFTDPAAAPDLVYLEMETIASMLLENDVNDANSLASQIMFDPKLREKVLQSMNGDRICWDREKLTCRFYLQSLSKSQKQQLNGCGTIFFWGINNKGRRVPLSIKAAGSAHEMLSGIDDEGQLWQIPFTPESITRGIQERRLLPAIFTCFLVLALARGVTCVGGYYQGEYLPFMQQGVVSALRDAGGYDDIAECVERVPTGSYLSGMQAVMHDVEDGSVIPAGPLEIIAGGGLSATDLQKALALTVRKAHLASLFETIPDITPWLLHSECWKRQLAFQCSYFLKDKVVLKKTAI